MPKYHFKIILTLHKEAFQTSLHSSLLLNFIHILINNPSIQFLPA